MAGTGSIIRVRKLKGLGQLDKPDSWMGASLPVVLGGGVAMATSVGIRHLITPTSEMQANMMRYAPWIGMGAGLLTAGIFAATVSQPAGLAAAAAATGVAGAILAADWVTRRKLAANAPGETVDAMTPYIGAVVMEPHASRGYGAGPLGAYETYMLSGQQQGTGAIVPEYSQTPGTAGVGAYGDVVNLQGISPGAFGTPGFQVAGR